MLNFKKTKLICTYGPALEKFLMLDLSDKEINLSSQTKANFSTLCNSGCNVIRFNMSHDEMKNHELRFNYFRQLSNETNSNLGLLIDTKGPEIRLGKIDLKNNLVKKDDVLLLNTLDYDILGNNKQIAVTDITHTYNLANDLIVGDKILIDDGKLILKVLTIDTKAGIIKTVSLTDQYCLLPNKRINLFNKRYSLPFLSDYDVSTIKNAVLWKADFLALSFISNLKQLTEVKKIINQTDPNSKIKIICKIETPEALDNIHELINNSDGIMVARGDLSLEIGYEHVPLAQDKILELCQQQNKISIIATQMLDSLQNAILPTRAEVTDCYYAVKSGVDSTMLSGESASSLDPINAIQVMNKIVTNTEKNLLEQNCFSNNYYFLDKNLKKVIKKIFYNSSGFKNVLLKKFSEQELRVISNSILEKNFFIIGSDYDQSTTFTLYKNLFIIKDVEELKEITNNNFSIAEKK